MTQNKTRPLIYEHKFQSLIGNYNSPYISNSNSPLFPWFHNHTHILIIQESEIRIVKKRILRERGESEIFMEIGKTESFVLLPLFSVCVGIGKTKDRLFPSLVLVLVLVFSLDLEAVPINGGVRAHNIAEMVSCRF